MENMSIRKPNDIKKMLATFYTVYIKNIFSKLFIAVDTAKLCKNCVSYEAKHSAYSSLVYGKQTG